MVQLAIRSGRYGYRRITNLLRIEGWQVNHKRVDRILANRTTPQVPCRQPKQVPKVAQRIARASVSGSGTRQTCQVLRLREHKDAPMVDLCSS